MMGKTAGKGAKPNAIFLAFALLLGLVGSDASARPPLRDRTARACALSFARDATAKSAPRQVFVHPTNYNHEAVTTPLSERKALRIVTYNMENLFLRVGSFKHMPGSGNTRVKFSDATFKSPEAQAQLAGVILEMNADIIVGQEVESLEAATQFSDEYLNGMYDVHLIEGNDERGIDVCFFVRKGLFGGKLISHKETPWPAESVGKEAGPVFSRDLPVFVALPPGMTEGIPLFLLGGTHYKSKRNRDGDPESRTMRGAQVVATAGIFDRLSTKTYPNAPYALAGDFNGDPGHEPEFRVLQSMLGMKDAFDLMSPKPDGDDRITHTYHPRDADRHAGQMDAVYFSGKFAPALKNAYVYRYKSRDGTELPIPQTFQDRQKNPSDHFPVVVDLDWQVLWANYVARGGGRLAAPVGGRQGLVQRLGRSR